MLHSMAVSNSMWSCVVNTVVYLRSLTYIRSVGLTGGIPLTLLTSSAPNASKFRVFGCAVFAKVPDKLRRKLGDKAFRGVMVGYPPGAPGYRVYNPETRRITTSVHVVFEENTTGFGTRLPIDSVITDLSDDDSAEDFSPQSHPIVTALSDLQPPPTAPRHARLRSHPLRYKELVAHMSDYPPTLVTACCDPEHGKAKEDIFEQSHVPDLITSPPHTPAGTSPTAVALLSARECVEPKSYLAALDNAHAPQWQAAKQHEYSSLIDNGTWELVVLPPSRVVVSNMWIYKVKPDTAGDVSRFKARFVAKGCSQRDGLDYTETFSPVILMASLRLFLAIATARDVELCQLDIDTAFLYVPIKEDVYNSSASLMAHPKCVISSAASTDL
jgi:hypothetical protein